MRIHLLGVTRRNPLFNYGYIASLDFAYHLQCFLGKWKKIFQSVRMCAENNDCNTEFGQWLLIGKISVNGDENIELFSACSSKAPFFIPAKPQKRTHVTA